MHTVKYLNTQLLATFYAQTHQPLLLCKEPKALQAYSSYNSCEALNSLALCLSKLVHFAAYIIIFLNPPDTLLELIDHFPWK